MVVGLYLPLNTLPPAGTPGHHLPMDSETTHLPTFGELLKLKEKQLQQETSVSAASIAAALATMQTIKAASDYQPFTTPLPVSK